MRAKLSLAEIRMKEFEVAKRSFAEGVPKRELGNEPFRCILYTKNYESHHKLTNFSGQEFGDQFFRVVDTIL